MKALTTISFITVFCAALVCLYSVPQVIINGLDEPMPLMEVLLVLPTLAGVLLAVIGTTIGVAQLARGNRSIATIFLATGQAVTAAIAAAIFIWAFAFASTGWELIMLPVSLGLGQIFVLTGLVCVVVRRHRVVRPG